MLPDPGSGKFEEKKNDPILLKRDTPEYYYK